MRVLLICAAILLSGCRGYYMNEISEIMVLPYDIPPPGTPAAELDVWFDRNGFAPGARVFQAESELRRRPGEPWAYALDADRSWWLTRVESVRNFCRTRKTVALNSSPLPIRPIACTAACRTSSSVSKASVRMTS